MRRPWITIILAASIAASTTYFCMKKPECQEPKMTGQSIDYFLTSTKEEIRKNPEKNNSYLDEMICFSIGLKEQESLKYDNRTIDRMFSAVEMQIGQTEQKHHRILWDRLPYEKKEKVVMDYFEGLPANKKWYAIKPILIEKIGEEKKRIGEDLKEIFRNLREGKDGAN